MMQLPPSIESRLHTLRPAMLAGDRAALDAVESAVAETRQPGLLVVAPPAVGAGAALPVVVLHQRTSMRGWEVMERDNLALLLWHPGSGLVRAVPAVVNEKWLEQPAPEVQRPPRPDESAHQTWNTGARRHELQARMGSLPVSGPIMVFALAYDWISNPAVVQVEGAAAAPAPPGMADVPAAGPGRLPSFDATSHHPALPTGEGVAFKVERLSDGRHLLLGSIAKSATPAEVLAASQPLATPTGPRKVTALVRVAVVVATLDQPQPATLSLVVPVFGDAALTAGQRLEARLAIDLTPLGRSRLPGRHLVYVLMAGAAHGPQPLPAP